MLQPFARHSLWYLTLFLNSNESAKDHASQAAAQRTPIQDGDGRNTDTNAKGMKSSASTEPSAKTTIKPTAGSSRVETTHGLAADDLAELVEQLNSRRLNRMFQTLVAHTQTTIDGLNTDEGRDFIRDWIHVHLRKFTRSSSAPLRACSVSLFSDIFDASPKATDNLPWNSLAGTFSSAGVAISGWPQGIPFPGQDTGRKSTAGIRALLVKEIRALVSALRFGRAVFVRRDSKGISISSVCLQHG